VIPLLALKQQRFVEIAKLVADAEAERLPPTRSRQPVRLRRGDTGCCAAALVFETVSDPNLRLIAVLQV
jgi:hypothetical protein